MPMKQKNVEEQIMLAFRDQLGKVEERFEANVDEMAIAAIHKLKKNEGDIATFSIGGFKFTFEGNMSDLRCGVVFDAGFQPQDKIKIQSDGSHSRWDNNQLKLDLGEHEDDDEETTEDPNLVGSEDITEE